MNQEYCNYCQIYRDSCERCAFPKRKESEGSGRCVNTCSNTSVIVFSFDDFKLGEAVGHE